MPGFVAAAVLSFVPAWVYAYLVYWLDRFEREPKKLLLGVFLWGAVVAAFAAGFAEIVFGEELAALTRNKSLTEIANAALFAPFIEESFKGAAILLVAVILHSEFDSLLDGLVYAGIVALGFAATENLFYLASAYVEHGWSALFLTFFVRVLLTGWNHPAFTAFTGLGIAVARLSQNLLLRLAAPFGGWLVAILLHSLFNALLSMQNGAIALLALCVSWTTWLLVLALVLVAISRDRARIREYLKDEVAAGILSPAQYRVASSAFSASITRLGAFGSGHYWDTRRFYQVCAELAQKKEQLQRFGNERGNTAEVEKLRAELGRLAPVAHA